MDFVNDSIYKISKILEEEINLQGGICNKRVSIIYRYFPKGEEGIKKIIELLDKERDIIALNGYHILKTSDELLRIKIVLLLINLFTISNYQYISYLIDNY